MKTPEQYAEEGVKAVLRSLEKNTYCVEFLGGHWLILEHSGGVDVFAAVQRIRESVAKMIAEARREMINRALGDSPVGEVRLEWIKQKVADWRCWQKDHEGKDTSVRTYDARIIADDLLAYIDHLEARIAWLCQEQDTNAVWEEGFKAGKASREQGKKSKECQGDAFCDHCEDTTTHLFHSSGHERDSSGDWHRCLVCGWTWRDVTDEYEPPDKG